MTRRLAALRLLLVLSFCNVALAQPTGTFTPTGSMTTPRFSHRSTLLADGRVLIAGGLTFEAECYCSKILASAEIYDPSSGTFTPTGEMVTPRDAFTSTFTLLPDGKVLATGGHKIGQALASAEVYDPQTGKFAVTGSMTTPRWGHTATLLNSGKVLIAGGATDATAELYDPSTGTFTATGSMSNPWADTATLLPNGDVLITGGNPDGPAHSSADLYDPATGTFASIADMNANHPESTAVLLPNGNVLVAGAYFADPGSSSKIAELFNPAIDTFARTGNMTYDRGRNTATLLPDGAVLFTGGSHEGSIDASIYNLATAELYDPVTGRFRSTGSMTRSRELHAATLLNDGTVLITGGDEIVWPSGILASAEIYTPAVLVPVLNVTDLQFDRINAVAGSSYSVNVSGSNLTAQTFFDVRFISPGSNESVVVLNWQKGLTASHEVAAGIATGSWKITGVRAHEIETDHTGNFFPVSSTITVSP